MIVIYRRWGLAFALAGALVGFLLLLATYSFSIPLLAIAALWIAYGRTGVDPETGEPIPSNSVFFIPLWVWGSVLLVPAVPIAAFEVTVGRPLAMVAAAERRREMAELSPADLPAPTPAPEERPPTTIDQDGPPPGLGSVAGTTPPPDRPPPRPVPMGRTMTLEEAQRELAKQHEAARKAFQDAHPEPPPPGQAVTETRMLKPGQKLLGKNGYHWACARVLAVADPGTLVIHWVDQATAFDERLKLDQVRINGEKDLDGPFGLKEKDERDLVHVRKPDRGAATEPGMRFLCDNDGLWLPVEVVRKVAPESVQVRWMSFDRRYDETVPASRLRLPIAEPPFGIHRAPPPGEPVTLLTDLQKDGPVLHRFGFEWMEVRVAEAVGIDHVQFFDPRYPDQLRKVKRSELRVQTRE